MADTRIHSQRGTDRPSGANPGRAYQAIGQAACEGGGEARSVCDPPVYDLAIIGGGINGVGIARDAAGRGLSVYLCEAGDLGGATSSASTKLAHGGLRYLEQYAFKLVRASLRERDILLATAPHIVWPLRFVLPQGRGQRPAWMIRLGLFLYDRLGGRRSLPGARALDLRRDAAGGPLKAGLGRAFAYWDGWAEDNRLAVLTARDAADRGATIAPRTRCTAAVRDGRLWRLWVTDVASEGVGGAARGEPGGRVGAGVSDRGAAGPMVRARALVNAAGPWAGQVLERVLGRPGAAPLRLVKGSHIVTRRLFDHDSAYLFQNDDGRVVFAIPYEGEFTLIGTTDQDVGADMGTPQASAAEIGYLCAAVSGYFRQPVTPDQVVWSYAGVRPLYAEAAETAGTAASASRDYALDLEAPAGAPPLLTVYGGKLTGYRHLAETALDRLATAMAIPGGRWTHAACLPGGDLGTDFERWAAAFAARHPWLDPALARRLARAYGSRADRIVAGAAAMADLGRHFGTGLYEAELAYAVAWEWVRSADDFLWRRTKLGLRLSPAAARDVAHWIAAHRPAAPDRVPAASDAP
ncbi:glycerol-3-phosphate dehydrogenase [Rhodothalassium salexigens]|nr:glycerol-3-phosphate dehydrogenase [Rhodothalassium salexigens]MBB4211782.1 glycerol-3-phosphate dehydrogenase [Rhodothalassium salexigens DSM 2132]MBK1640008.1 glycerol-3-phosphate dehydrogenase [Rhodothalassium salexigens DSM 2132]